MWAQVPPMPQSMLPFSFFILIFSFWMVVDAIRRSAELYWYFVILLVPFGIGAFIYFFAVKMRDFDLRRATAGRAPNQPLAVLRQRVDHAPSPQNRLALADALCETEAFREAGQLYQGVLDESANDKAALLGLARTCFGMGRTAEAIEWYERLLELDREYANYSAALEYAEALWQDGRKQDAVELLEAVARLTGRPNHKVAHAHYLMESGQMAAARPVLEEVLREFEASSTLERKKIAKWAERARDLLNRFDVE